MSPVWHMYFHFNVACLVLLQGESSSLPCEVEIGFTPSLRLEDALERSRAAALVSAVFAEAEHGAK